MITQRRKNMRGKQPERRTWGKFILENFSIQVSKKFFRLLFFFSFFFPVPSSNHTYCTEPKGWSSSNKRQWLEIEAQSARFREALPTQPVALEIQPCPMTVVYQHAIESHSFIYFQELCTGFSQKTERPRTYYMLFISKAGSALEFMAPIILTEYLPQFPTEGNCCTRRMEYSHPWMSANIGGACRLWIAPLHPRMT